MLIWTAFLADLRAALVPRAEVTDPGVPEPVITRQMRGRFRQLHIRTILGLQVSPSDSSNEQRAQMDTLKESLWRWLQVRFPYHSGSRSKIWILIDNHCSFTFVETPVNGQSCSCLGTDVCGGEPSGRVRAVMTDTLGSAEKAFDGRSSLTTDGVVTEKRIN